MELGRRDDLRQFLHVGRLDVDDVEALVGDLQVPQIKPEVVRREVRLLVRVDRYRVDVVGVSIGKNPTGRGLHHQIHWLYRWHPQRADRQRITYAAVVLPRVVTFDPFVPLGDLPQLYRLVVGRQQEVRLVLALQPSDLVDFLLYF